MTKIYNHVSIYSIQVLIKLRVTLVRHRTSTIHDYDYKVQITLNNLFNILQSKLITRKLD